MFSNKKVIDNALAKSLRGTTTARIGIGHVGGRYPTAAHLAFQLDFAAAKDTVHRETDPTRYPELGLLTVTTRAQSRAEYLRNTSVGRKLDDESAARLAAGGTKGADVQLVVSDGLSADAFEKNVPEMLPLLHARLAEAGVKVATPIFVRRARVAIIDHIGEILKPKAALILIGERPGLGISDSLSGYFEWEPGFHRVEADRNVLSNIHGKGVPPAEAALQLAEALLRVLSLKSSGMNVRFDFH